MDDLASLQELRALLDEAERGRLQERQRAEESDRARQEADRARQEADRARQEADRARQEAERGRLQERQRAEEADRARQEADRARDEAQQRAEKSEQHTRPTTLEEYITTCHVSVFSEFRVQTDPELTTKGTITSPRHKWCPTVLKPWTDLVDKQRAIFGALYETFGPETRAFESRSFLVGLGARISGRVIGDEKALEYFLHNSVEDPVRAVLEKLRQVDEVRSLFQLGHGVVFDNHPHAISDVSPEVVDSEAPATPPSTPGPLGIEPGPHGIDMNQLRPDQICIYRAEGPDGSPAGRTMLFISEYKPPHKLTAPHLRLGLKPMSIYRDVVNRKQIPTSLDENALFQYHAERLTASAITQTYHYMVEGGLEFGLLTTGEIIVFLRIDWNDPGTLLYHLAEPAAEVLAHPDHFLTCTAVGQYLALSLLALGSSGHRRLHNQAERQRATAKLKTWAEDFDATLHSIPVDQRRAPMSSPGYVPVTYVGVDRSPYLMRGKKKQIIWDEPVKEKPLRDSEDSSDDESTPPPPDTPCPGEARRSRRIRAREQGSGAGGGAGAADGKKHAKDGTGRGPADGQHHTQDDSGTRPAEEQHCTQKCLLGLVRGHLLDPACPNVALHRVQDGGRGRGRLTKHSRGRHPIDHSQFLDLLHKQLKASLDDGIIPLHMGGARGVLFKVTLLAYGYTFISKGTVRAFIKDLEYEAAIYERLQSLQGVGVPVFLGAVDLRPMNKIYYYDHRVQEVKQKAAQTLRAIHEAGVAHRDVRKPNMLFNDEVDGVMMIDFERSMMLNPARPPLAQVMANQQGRQPETKERGKSSLVVSCRSKMSQGQDEDIRMLGGMFYQPKDV
ncbi:hypothetical protein G6O67_006714 [Ophiocordyceps sinensis]|uniref:Protein kinase domain-containing protein n=1 Tax=Ophiocordyceps sinensis TaxID=72228 RepID=A0A8H4PP80_9HYPO|nr:hypothetical protein G6O67_006714 [Ophiocordyceps sinensis]